MLNPLWVDVVYKTKWVSEWMCKLKSAYINKLRHISYPNG